MTTYVLEFWLDGYTNDEKRIEAEKEFIYEQLNMTASSVKVRQATPAELAAPEMLKGIKNIQEWLERPDAERPEPHVIVEYCAGLIADAGDAQ